MKLKEAREQFIQSWGSLGSNWGINRTMAQIHALLLVSTRPLSTDELMEELKISRGNANMNVRALIDWELVEKVLKPGERMEFFQAEKDIWKIATRIATERRKRELKPMIRVVSEVKNVKDPSASREEVKEFKKVMEDLESFTLKTDKMFDKFTSAEEKWFTSILLKMIR